ncbi:hypothetical protein CF65_02066 [Aggregatibacter actinomycetemcomitans HK1651]|nr:hypothetical protein CF65_02066 [Aggregatibacter actinomycetemcomitans HK1651]
MQIMAFWYDVVLIFVCITGFLGFYRRKVRSDFKVFFRRRH